MREGGNAGMGAEVTLGRRADVSNKRRHSGDEDQRGGSCAAPKHTAGGGNVQHT